MSVRILNAEPAGYCEEARAILRTIGELIEEPVTQDELAERVTDADILIVRVALRVTDEVLQAGHRLKAVVSAVTGLDHIDVEAARKRRVAVLSLVGEGEFLKSVPSTAEHTWSLLLALLRRTPWSFRSVLEGQWNRNAYRGRDLHGRRLGILGLGRIGEQIARFGVVFGMKVGAYTLPRGDWLPDVERFDSLEELLRWCDILTIHVPLNDGTRGLLGKEALHVLRPGAVVVNTARGAIVDEAALVEALESGHLAGAAVDVLAEEQPAERRRRSPLLRYAVDHDNLLITPHLGGASVESMERTELFLAAKLRAFLAGVTT